MKREKLKTPADYAIFSFRIDDEAKSRLNSALKKVVALYNRGKAKDERAFRKNEIILEALEIGLETMKRKKSP